MAALLVGALPGLPTVAAGWSLRAEPATGGKVPGCSMVSEHRLALHIDDPAKRAAFVRALDDL